MAHLFSLLLSSLGTHHHLSLIITLLFLYSHYHHLLFLPSSLSSHFLLLIFLHLHRYLHPFLLVLSSFISLFLSLPHHNHHPYLLTSSLSSFLFHSFSSSFHCLITIIISPSLLPLFSLHHYHPFFTPYHYRLSSHYRTITISIILLQGQR